MGDTPRSYRRGRRCAPTRFWLDAGEFDAVRLALLPDTPAAAGQSLNGGAGWTAFDALTEATLAQLPMFLDG